MTWVVDTCVVLDVFENDPSFGKKSATLLQRLLPDGLVISPVTMIELAAAFEGNLAEQKAFLDQAAIAYSEPWTGADLEAAHSGWNAYVQARRSRSAGKRPVADLMIGGFALHRHGLVTRNPADFRPWFPRLVIREP